MGNVKTVKTSDNPTNILPNIGDMSLEQKAELFALLRRDNSVVTQAKASDEAELNRLNAKKSEIETALAPLNKELGDVITAIRALTGKTTVQGAPRTRTTNTCAECGQGRHADNEKTRACKSYAAAQAAKTAQSNAPAAQASN